MDKKFIGIIILVAGLIVAVLLAIQLGMGNFKTVYITSVLLFSIPTLLLLGLRSWYALPFAMLAELPAFPLVAGRSVSLAELSVTMFSGLMVLAFLQGRRRFRMKWKDWWPMLIYGGWVLIIAAMNGGGFAILGSAAMGGRRYLTVIIALVGMFMLSQVTIRELEAKRVCWLIFVAMALSGVYHSFSIFLGSSGVDGAYAFYSWQQGLSFISLGGVFLLFSRYSPSKIIGSPLKLVVYLFLLAIVVYSGKRMAFAGCCAIPLAACVWHRQGKYAFVTTILGGCSLIGIVLVQNYGAEVPKSMQRVLAFIPADWSYDVKQSTDNIFRETLNRWAFRAVEERPILGKGVSMTTEDYRLMLDVDYVRKISGPDDDPQAFPHIAGKNWHSTWLGLAASFGIPAALAWISVQIFVLRRSWKIGHYRGLGIWCRTLVGMLFFFMIYGIMRSLSSGDVAILAMHGGLYLGLLSAVRNGVELEMSESQTRRRIGLNPESLAQ